MSILPDFIKHPEEHGFTPVKAGLPETNCRVHCIWEDGEEEESIGSYYMNFDEEYGIFYIDYDFTDMTEYVTYWKIIEE